MGKYYCMISSAPGGPYNKASVVRLNAKSADMARKETYVRLLARKLDLDWTMGIDGDVGTVDGILGQFGIHERVRERTGSMTWGPIDNMVDYATTQGRSLNPRVLEVVREIEFDIDDMEDVREEVKGSVVRSMKKGEN